MPKRFTLLAVCGLVAIAARARGADSKVADASGADEETGEPGSFDPPPAVTVEEAPARIRLWLAPGFARGTVRRALLNTDAEPGEGVLEVKLPDGAAATGLRSLLPTGRGGVRAFHAELRGATEADALYARARRAVGTPGGDAALLAWTETRDLDLRIAPLFPGLAKEVDYDFEVPTEFREGASHLALDPEGDPPSEVEVFAATAEDDLWVDGHLAAAGTRVVLDRDHDVAVRVRGRGMPLAVDAVSVPMASGRAVTRLELRASDPLEPAPVGARVVVALDASRSVRDPRALVAAAVAYLREMPEAQVGALAFSRRVRPLWTGFVPVDEAVRRLEAARPARENGSELGDALVAADVALLDAPSTTARRVVAFGDSETRSSLAPESLARLRSGAVVHVVDVERGTPSLARDDDDAWAVVARRTGGLAWHAAAELDPDVDRGVAHGPIHPLPPVDDEGRTRVQRMRHVFEELAHPLAIDRLAVHASFPVADAFGLPDALGAGEGSAYLAISERTLGPVTVRGELWSRPLEIVARDDSPSAERAWAGLAAVDPPGESPLTDAELLELARRGGVVTAKTSFVLAPPGARTVSRDGDIAMSSIGGIGGIGTVGRSRAQGPPQPAGLAETLKAMLEARSRACGPRGAGARVTIETTEAEVVDVPLVETPNVPAGDAAKLCLREAAWALALPPAFESVARRTWEVALGP